MGGKISITDKKTIAAFDFDGTITKRDTLPVFIIFVASIFRFISGTIQMIPYLALFKLKIIPNYHAKERLFKTFFSGFELDEFNLIANKFAAKIDQMVNPAALGKIRWHQEMGHEVIIISASAENWIIPWATKNGINTVLATKLEIINGRITGNFLSKNCHGEEKVNRLLEAYPDKSDYTLYAYGDTNGDKELLALADHPFYRSF